MEARAPTGFTAAFFQTQHASFSVRFGAVRLPVAMEHEKNKRVCARDRQNNRTATGLRLPIQASPQIMDLDFKNF